MKRYQRILVPVDGSDLSDSAFEQAVTLGQMTGGEVTVLHVIEPIPFSYHNLGENEIGAPNMGTLMENKERVEDMLKHYERHGEEEGVEVHRVTAKGNVAEEIIRASSGYDIVIMGTLGRNAVASLLLGSSAEKVARYACCPVMLVREIGSECRI